MAAKAIYWVDANVFISAKKGPYPFELFPQFWSFLATKVASGEVQCPRLVYQEIVNNFAKDDELSVWFKTRKSHGLCVMPTENVQLKYGLVVNHVANSGRYREPFISEFLKGADPWLIAHALEGGGRVVTLESSLHPLANKVRIPDVSKHFHVQFLTTVQMLSALKAKF